MEILVIVNFLIRERERERERVIVNLFFFFFENLIVREFKTWNYLSVKIKQ